MKTKTTPRGFRFKQFRDRYSLQCSLQESSLAAEEAIWFGVDNPAPRYLSDIGWRDFPLPDNVTIPSRMHLTKEMVKELIPVLQYFVDNGCLPSV